MLIIERHRLQKRLLQKHRGLILLATAFALLAVVVDMGWQQAAHMSSTWDLLLQVLMGVAFVAALVFFVVDSSGFVLNLGLIFVTVAVIGELSRFYLSLYSLAWGDVPGAEISTSLNYWPVIIVALFGLLPERLALPLSILLIALCLFPFLLFVITHSEQMNHSSRLIDVLHTVLIINPVVCIFGVVLGRMKFEVGAYKQTVTPSDNEAGSKIDHNALTINRSGMRRSLFELVEKARGSGLELTVGMLELASNDGMDLDLSLPRALRLLNQHLPVVDPVIGRWSNNCLLFFVQDQHSQGITSAGLNVLEELNAGAANPNERASSMSLVAFFPGETVTSLLQRASEQLELAKAKAGEGLETDGL